MMLIQLAALILNLTLILVNQIFIAMLKCDPGNPYM